MDYPNRGIIVGTVYAANGQPAKGALVRIHKVYEGTAPMRIQKFDARSDSQGNFKLAFLWQPIEYMYDMSSGITISLTASTEKNFHTGNVYHSMDTAFGARKIKGFVAPDILHPLNVAAGNPFASVPDMLDFAIGIGQALANYKNLVPFWKIPAMMGGGAQVIGAGIKQLWLDNSRGYA
jgi:hypothetical protein